MEGEVKERLTRVQNDDEDSDDEDGIPEPEGNGGEGWESMEED